MSAHIAVVDDDPLVRETVAEYLSRQGLRVSACDGGAALDRLMAGDPVDLVVLDVNMPGEDGISVARRLRVGGGIGIVMLTANSDSFDQVIGLEVGADDYVVKPFEPRVLLARVRAVLRRAAEVAQPLPATRRVRFGRAVLDLDARRLLDSAGAEIAITAMEFDLLRTFAENPGKPLSRDRILDLAHDRDMEPFDRSVDSRVKRLRRKIEADPSRPATLKTVHGVGYVFAPGN
jgi:two-component system phosphate regulon response regulator OmpR